MNEAKPIYIKFKKKQDFKLVKVSFEIEATDSGVSSIINRVQNFLKYKTTWNYKNLKSEVL